MTACNDYEVKPGELLCKHCGHSFQEHCDDPIAILDQRAAEENAEEGFDDLVDRIESENSDDGVFL